MPSGILIVNKPQDWTSMDVCAKLRGVFHEKRIGHAGTLDPMATGVLPVFVGRATRCVQFAETGEKEYLAGLRLGLVTNTQDVWGETLETRPVPADAEKRLQELLPRFTGEIDQLPPMYSAVKINGKRLYELARKGVEVERKPRKVTICALDLTEPPASAPGGPPPHVFLRVRCSKGTYIRTLCHDIGQALGCGGCMASLVRTEACGFSLDRALPLDQIVSAPDPAALLLPVDRLFADRKALTLKPEGEKKVRSGASLKAPKLPAGEYRVYGADGSFLALSKAEKGLLTTIKSCYEV